MSRWAGRVVQEQEVHRPPPRALEGSFPGWPGPRRDESGPSGSSWARLSEHRRAAGARRAAAAPPSWPPEGAGTAGGTMPSLVATVTLSPCRERNSPSALSASPYPYDRAVSKCVIPLSWAASSRRTDSRLPSRAISRAEPKARRVGVKSVPGSSTFASLSRQRAAVIGVLRLESGWELVTDLCMMGAARRGSPCPRVLRRRHQVILLESGGLSGALGADSLNGGESSGMDPESLTAGRGRRLAAPRCCGPASACRRVRSPWRTGTGCPTVAGHSTGPSWSPTSAVRSRCSRSKARCMTNGSGRASGSRPPGGPEPAEHRFSVWCPQPHLGRLYRDPLASSPNVRVMLNATVTELGLDGATECVGSIRVATPEGNKRRCGASVCAMRGRDRERAAPARI